MENFVVSARKYRPSTFETVVGQNSITSTLKNAIKQQQLAQAFLFCGPRGVGKTTCARILAKTINCTHVTENFEPCNVCDSCISFNEQTSFNIHELDAASNNSVDDIRALVDQVRIPPQAGRYKVYIIDEVHMLSASAFNAFLKTLEEPPPYAKFILATTEKHKIIPTILSRCQIFDFKRITVDDIAKHLLYVANCEKIRFEEDALHMIAQKADGALRDALSIFDQIAISSDNNITFQSVIDNLNILDYEYYFRMTEIILENNIHEALNQIEKVIENGFDGQIFLAGFASHLRSLLVCKDEITLKLLESSESIKRKYKDLASRCPESFLVRNLEIANRFDFEYKNSNNKRLHVEIAFIQMCTIATSTGKTTVQTEEIKKKVEPANIASEDNKVYTPAPKTTLDTNTSQPVKKASITVGNVVSLKDEKKPEEVEVVKESEIRYGEEPFGEAKLFEAWEEMAKEYEKQPTFYSGLIQHKPELISDYKYSILLDNKTLMEKFASNKPAILHFLKTALKNNQLEIEEQLNTENNGDAKPYSSMDKFKAMTEKNPDLQLFKDQLDLDIEY